MNHNVKSEVGTIFLNSYHVNIDYCVICGAPVPEGRMICWICEHQFDEV